MEIKDKQGITLAIIIKAKNINYQKNFLTKNDDEFQVASFGLRSGEKIERHYHPKQSRTVFRTSEVLVIIEGTLTAKIFDEELIFISSHVLEQGDTIALIRGGHELEMDEDCKFIEVKQGPYDEKTDKVRF